MTLAKRFPRGTELNDKNAGLKYDFLVIRTATTRNTEQINPQITVVTRTESPHRRNYIPYPHQLINRPDQYMRNGETGYSRG